MTLSLDPHPSFAGRSGPVLVIVADGVGVAPPGPSNAVTEASTPMLDALTASEHSCELAAHGVAVGLPTDDDMGNSEVGHNALGAGRIFAQGAKLVNQAIASGSIFEGETWQAAVERGRDRNTALPGPALRRQRAQQHRTAVPAHGGGGRGRRAVDVTSTSCWTAATPHLARRWTTSARPSRSSRS